jgi:AcrR family transcriptional regulator
LGWEELSFLVYIEQMLKASAQGAATRGRILGAAFETVRRDGYANTSARAIARRGGFNQALIFYHFGDLNQLLLAALDRVGEERRQRYEEVLGSPADLLEFAARARSLYSEDVDTGHATVVAELFAASSGNPVLREHMLARMKSWLEFTEELIKRFLEGSPLAALIDPRAAAGAVLALYLGMDLLIHLDGDRSRATDLFDSGDRLAATLGPLFGGGAR